MLRTQLSYSLNMSAYSNRIEIFQFKNSKFLLKFFNLFRFNIELLSIEHFRHFKNDIANCILCNLNFRGTHNKILKDFVIQIFIINLSIAIRY